jgi:G3E family GTPase
MNATQEIPVTVLSGSLGAGKTTLLNNVLNTEKDLNAAVVVNDMGEVNIDAELVEETETTDDEEIIELSNGCICCRLRGDLLDEVGRLAKQRDFEYLLVESSGISEPIPVAQTFALGYDADFAPEDTGRDFDPSEVYELDTTVTVVNAHSIYENFSSGAALTDEDVDAESDRMPEGVVMDQIEFCDVLVVNKCDMVPDEELDEIEEVLRTLQPRAKIIRSEHGDVEPDEVLDTGRFDFEEAQSSAGWMHELEEGHHHEDAAEEHGVTSFVYRERRPFHPERIEEFLADIPENVIRAKGYFWIPSADEVAMGIDKAGTSVRAGPSSRWLASLSEEKIQAYFERYPEVEDEWHPDWGDRNTKLVFIGREIDAASIEEELDACVMTDEELERDWNVYDNPFDTEGQTEFAE